MSKLSLTQKIQLFCHKLNPINKWQEEYTKLVIQEQYKRADDLNNVISEKEALQLYREQSVNETRITGQKIEKAFREKHHYQISDFSYNLDISKSHAYQTYYQCYNKMYNNWVQKKRKEENKKLTEDTKIAKNRREHNKNIGNAITYEDYQDLFNVIQSSYLLMLVNVKQLSIKCTLDTILLLQLVDNKMMDYIMPNLLKIHESIPTVDVILEFVVFHDNSVIVRISDATIHSDKKDTTTEVNNIFTTIRKNLIDNGNHFKQFVKNNKQLIELLNEEYELAELSDEEKLENSMVKTRKENLAIATFTYINNYNILLEEMRRGVIVGVNDFRTILESIKHIETVAIQKTNETHFESEERLAKMIQEAKNKEIETTSESSANSGANNDSASIQSEENKSASSSYTLRVGGNTRNYEILTTINTNEELLTLIRKRRLYVKPIRVKAEKQNKYDDNGKYISNKARKAQEKKEKLTVKLVNEEHDKFVQPDGNNE